MCDLLFIFFFKQKTAYEMRISDWSSDVCSSDLFAADSILQPSGNAFAVADPMIAYSLIGSVSLADWSLYAWRPNTLGADCRCLRHCHGDDLGRNAMGSLSPRLPVPAWSAVVRSGRMAVLLSARLLLVVVLL